MTTQKQIRKAFWNEHPVAGKFARKNKTFSKGQNAQNATVRSEFVDWLDNLEWEGKISTALANRATL